MSAAWVPPVYARRAHVLDGCVGSLPAAWALERLPRSLALICAGLACLTRAGAPLPLPVAVVAWSGFAAWVLCALGHCLNFAACRGRSRAGGLEVLVVVPESPCVVRRVCRRSGLWAPWRPYVLAVHVDDRWRAPSGLTPVQASQEFARRYRADYDRLLAGLAGRPALVLSSTFNRHESEWTSLALRHGWCRTAAGPLFPSAPARHRPSRRAGTQRRMLGGLASDRRVDRPGAWRTRVFDCRLAQAGVALEG